LKIGVDQSAGTHCAKGRFGNIANGMVEPASISPQIVEGLYCEALVLADEVRAAFSLSQRTDPPGRDEDLVRIALSCEGLRTTTRIMHALAWLLNQRSFLMGELTEFQLRRHGRLSRDLRSHDPENLALLPRETRDLVAETERFYRRLMRLDEDWRQIPPNRPSALDTLRWRVQRQV
jgi:regulator of CtrA degradation